MKKGQVYEGIVERVDFPNKGIVKVGEDTVIVKNSLPGQKVKLSVNKVRKGKAEGRLLEVIEKSPLETGNPCSHFGLCGGCCYLSLPYEEQLAVKEKQVKKLLDSVLYRQKTDYHWEGIKGSPKEYEYRNKMEFSFGDEYMGGPLALGMHKRGSFYDIVSVEDCEIVDGDYRAILKTVREFFAKNNVTFFHRLRHEGYLRHLLVRKASGTGEILVALVTTSQNPWGEKMQDGQESSLLEQWLQALLNLQENGILQGRFAGILHIVNDSIADVVKSDWTDILYGQDYFYEELLGLKFKISTFSFFQTNSYSAAVLYETAREYVGDLGGKDKTVFDLYSGTGTIAQLMAPAAGKVIGVEIVEEAVEAAKRNAADNHLNNCEFIAGDVLKVLDEVKEKPDMIILDPPRDGIHPKALPKIIAYGVEHIVYISCKPTSLVRDLEVFLDNGYAVEKAVAVDQFPWTANVETVVLLSGQCKKVTCGEDLDAIRKVIDTLPEGNHTIAIDGRSAAGKSTLAARLAEAIGAEVVHMDDFFLPEELRTEERLAEPGGNVHYERFREEVLPFLNKGEDFSYGRFDCSSMGINESCDVKAARFIIVEGAYSCHPGLGDYMSLKIFMDIDGDSQMRRICERDGEVQAEHYKTRWIPMEETYFSTYGIRENADLVIGNE